MLLSNIDTPLSIRIRIVGTDKAAKIICNILNQYLIIQHYRILQQGIILEHIHSAAALFEIMISNCSHIITHFIYYVDDVFTFGKRSYGFTLYGITAVYQKNRVAITPYWFCREARPA